MVRFVNQEPEMSTCAVPEAVEDGRYSIDTFKEFFSEGLVELFDMLHEDIQSQMPDRCPSGLAMTPPQVSRVSRQVFSKEN